MEKLRNGRFTTHERIDKLVQWIPKKGSDGLTRFITALKDSTEGTGHAELAKLLEKAVKKGNERKESTGLLKCLKGIHATIISNHFILIAFFNAIPSV